MFGNIKHDALKRTARHCNAAQCKTHARKTDAPFHGTRTLRARGALRGAITPRRSRDRLATQR
eukprot:5306574-Lingulodinium_polyedra.AAC.1